ncbi:MAG TPA: ABC transporter permease [Pseudothermotoga sp.]|nr:ABC transporter permease [Pseudothermotoga sp.]HOK83801.1 ABC transporter permease [Pseudothermotoga sp.]HPP70295.1 ABC transporter permease [Pseudothermotoga sp.]
MSASYLLKRIFQMFLTIVIAVTVSFILIRALPGDPAERFYGDPRIPEEVKQQIKAAFGLDKPVFIQYLSFLKQFFKGDLGVSYTYNRRVVGVVLERLPWTLLLTAVPTLLSMVASLKIGVYIGCKRNSFADRVVRYLAFALHSVPTFWFALLLVMLFSFKLGWFPLQGMIDPNAQGYRTILSLLYHAFLPWVVLFVINVPGFAIYVRNMVISILGEEFIVTAKAKGLAEAEIRRKHILRNALGPLFSMLTLRIAGMLGGAVLIETIFSWKGMGLLVLEASRNSDYPLLQATVLITIISVILANFFADLLQVAFDPRVRFE